MDRRATSVVRCNRLALVKQLLSLCIGVIRDAALYRTNSAARLRADAEYKAVRPRVMEDQQYRCRFCGYVSKRNHCHHLDGNHANNASSNFAVADSFCHAYHHLGQTASQDQFAHENLGRKTVLAALPELSATDTNLLQRAIGVAMADPVEADMATRMHTLLMDRSKPVKESFGSFLPADFAAAMTSLQSDEEYENREAVVGDLRLIFRPDVLKHEGARFLEEFSSLPVQSWANIAKNARNTAA